MTHGPIVLPWPDKRVWPNYRQSHHWRSYRAPVKAQRELAWALMLRAGGKACVRWNEEGTKVPLVVRIYPPDHRRRDRDGMIGACKSILDGVSDATGVNDQYFAADYQFMPPEKPGRVEVMIG